MASLLKKYNEPEKVIFFASALITVLFALIILIFVFSNAMPIFQKEGLGFIFGMEWNYDKHIYGILPFIAGTIALTTVTLIIASPLSILTAIFMAEFAPKWLTSIMRPMIELLVGIPSIVYGYFGLIVLRDVFAYTINPLIGNTLGFIPIFRDVAPGLGLGIPLASTVLMIMILPTITALSLDALKSVPKEFKEASYSLGATRLETIGKVMLPTASSGILTGIILGVMRAMGETMAILILLGNAPRIPTSVLDIAYAMTSKIVIDFNYYVVIPEAKSALFGIAAVLFIMEIIFLIIARSIGGRRYGN